MVAPLLPEINEQWWKLRRPISLQIGGCTYGCRKCSAKGPSLARPQLLSQNCVQMGVKVMEVVNAQALIASQLDTVEQPTHSGQG